MSEHLQFWINVGAYYQKNLGQVVLSMYAHDCKDVSVEELKEAFKIYRKGKNANFFPLPATLLNILNPAVDDEAEANEVPAIIFKAIKKFGYMGAEGARAFMGPLAWDCVESIGGWNHLCSSPNLGSEATLRAQLRDMARSKVSRIRSGSYQLAPGKAVYDSLPDARNSNENGPRIDLKLKNIVTHALSPKNQE